MYAPFSQNFLFNLLHSGEITVTELKLDAIFARKKEGKKFFTVSDLPAPSYAWTGLQQPRPGKESPFRVPVLQS